MAVNKHWIASALAGAALTLPFAALELANRPAAGYAFPVPLFGALWLLAGTFALLLAPLLRGGPPRCGADCAAGDHSSAVGRHPHRPAALLPGRAVL